LIKESCRVAATEEEGGRLGDLVRQMGDKSGFATGGQQELLQGARLPVVI
jgi:hypothetical protein